MEGAKELVAEIDPDNKLDEVHESWNPDVPGGNNFGYFPFSVVKPQSMLFSRIANPDITLTINGKSMSDFIEYAAEQPGAFDAECVVTNNTGTSLNAVLELDMITAENARVGVFTHNIGVMQGGENHSFTFLVQPENWKSCEGLEAVFYTDGGVIRMSNKDSGGAVSSSSSGCNSGIAFLGLGIVLFMKRK